ncbi:MAG: YraN family protein [Candidatus Hydrogenedentales bacterium]
MIWPFRRRKPKPLGGQGEDLAAKHLKREGYVILDRNVEVGRYELDIIAMEDDTVAFVEVKTRRDDGYAAPEDNITPSKQRHIRSAAHRWLNEHEKTDVYYRFDVVTVVLPESGEARIVLYRNAFPDVRPVKASVAPRARLRRR